MSSKYILAPISAEAELILLMKVIIAHTDEVMEPIQCHDPFCALAIVWDLSANAFQNKMVSLTDKEAVDKSMRFLAELMAAVQSLVLEEE